MSNSVQTKTNFLGIDWKSRVTNPLFWVAIVVSVISPILVYFGVQWKDMTTWAALGQIFVDAVQNPVVVVSVIVSVFNTVVDYKTSGFSDKTTE